jgi:hypothetical protein
MIVLFVIWATVTTIVAGVGLLTWFEPVDAEDKRHGARLFLFGWAWPFLLFPTIVKMIQEMRDEIR